MPKLPSIVSRRALVFGLSHAPTARTALSAIEAWISPLRKDFEEHLPVVLPLLSDYLLQTKDTDSYISTNLSETEFASDTSNRITSLKSHDSVVGRQARAKRRRERQRRQKALIESSHVGDDEATHQAEQAAMSAALPLHVRIIRLLGKLGGRCHDLVNANNKPSSPAYIEETALSSSFSSILSQYVSWDTKNSRRVSIPVSFGPSIKLDICFDDMLPRIALLAETAQLRQTKSAACELLHALMLSMIARNAQRSVAGRLTNKSTNFVTLYKRLFPVMLRLSVDAEDVARQLFAPLTMQLVRWFTQSAQQEEEQTMVLLESIVDGVGDQSNAALRMHCAAAMAEFLKWSMKHSEGRAARQFQTGKRRSSKSIGAASSTTASGEARMTSFNIDSLLQRLYTLMVHPDYFKRIGAALAFNAMYAQFRENKYVVRKHAIELTKNLILSLRGETSNNGFQSRNNTQNLPHELISSSGIADKKIATASSSKSSNESDTHASVAKADTVAESSLSTSSKQLLTGLLDDSVIYNDPINEALAHATRILHHDCEIFDIRFDQSAPMTLDQFLLWLLKQAAVPANGKRCQTSSVSLFTTLAARYPGCKVSSDFIRHQCRSSRDASEGHNSSLFENLEDFLNAQGLGTKSLELPPDLSGDAHPAKAIRYFEKVATLFQCYSWLFRTKTIAISRSSVEARGISDETTDSIMIGVLNAVKTCFEKASFRNPGYFHKSPHRVIAKALFAIKHGLALIKSILSIILDHQDDFTSKTDGKREMILFAERVGMESMLDVLFRLISQSPKGDNLFVSSNIRLPSSIVAELANRSLKVLKLLFAYKHHEKSHKCMIAAGLNFVLLERSENSSHPSALSSTLEFAKAVVSHEDSYKSISSYLIRIRAIRRLVQAGGTRISFGPLNLKSGSSALLVEVILEQISEICTFQILTMKPTLRELMAEAIDLSLELSRAQPKIILRELFSKKERIYLLDLFMTKFAKFFLRPSIWPVVCMDLLSQLNDTDQTSHSGHQLKSFNSNTESASIILKLLDLIISIQCTVLSSDRIPSDRCSPKHFCDVFLPHMENNLFVWAFGSSNVCITNLKTKQKYRERASRLLRILRDLGKLYSWESTFKQRTTASLEEQNFVLMKLLKHAVICSLKIADDSEIRADDPFEQSVFDLVAIILPGFSKHASLKLPGIPVVSGNSCGSIMEEVTFPRAHQGILNAVCSYFKSKKDISDLKCLLSLIERTGCLYLLPCLWQFIPYNISFRDFSSILLDNSTIHVDSRLLTPKERRENSLDEQKLRLIVDSLKLTAKNLRNQKISDGLAVAKYLLSKSVLQYPKQGTEILTSQESHDRKCMLFRDTMLSNVFFVYLQRISVEMFIKLLTTNYAVPIGSSNASVSSLFSLCRDSIDPRCIGSDGKTNPDLPWILFSLDVIILAWQRVNNHEYLETQLLRHTHDWRDVKTDQVIEEKSVVVKSLTKHVVHCCCKLIESDDSNLPKSLLDMNNESPFRLMLRQSAFNCLAQTVCTTQTKLRVFTKYIFSTKYFKKGGIIDYCAGVNISDLTLNPGLLKTRWYKGRPGHGKTIFNADSTGIFSSPLEEKLENGTGSLQYLASQYLDNSSLASAFINGVAGAGDAAFDDIIQVEELAGDLHTEIGSKTDSDANIESEATHATKSASNVVASSYFDNNSSNSDPDTKMSQSSNQESSMEDFEEILVDTFNANPCMEFIVFVVDTLEDLNCKGKINFEEQWSTDSASNSSAKVPQHFRVAKGQMPAWMNVLLSVMHNDTTSENPKGYSMASRLFVLKLLLNRPVPFAPFAKNWIEAILSLCLELDCGSVGYEPKRGFHYILRDVCRLLEFWNCSDLPITRRKDNAIDAKIVAKSFLTHLCKVCVHNNKNVLSNNLGHIRHLMELWKDTDVFDPAPVWDLFMCRGKDRDATWVQKLFNQYDLKATLNNAPRVNEKLRDLMHRVSLNLMAAALANRFKLYSTAISDLGIQEKDLYTHKKFGLATLLQHKDKRLRIAAAQIIGMMLHRAGNHVNPMSPVGQLRLVSTKVLRNLLQIGSDRTSRESSVSQYLQMLHHICAPRYGNFSAFITEEILYEICILIVTLPSGDDRALALHLACMYLEKVSSEEPVSKIFEKYNELWKSVRAIFMVKIDIIERFHISTQKQGVLLIEKLMKIFQNMNDEPIPSDAEESLDQMKRDLLSLIDPLNTCGLTTHMIRHADSTCRMHFYMFCCRLYDANHKCGSQKSLLTLQHYIHEILTRGLADSSRLIRSKLKEFWHGDHSAPHLPNSSKVDKTPDRAAENFCRLEQTLTGRIRKLLLPSCGNFLRKSKGKRQDSSIAAHFANFSDTGLYSVHSEVNWLEFSSYLTLSLVEGTQDYERYLPGCEDALADCQFVEIGLDHYIANSTFREDGASMQPKYASFVSQFVNHSIMSQHLGGSQNLTQNLKSRGQILATQDAENMRYVATQAGGGGSLAVQLDNQHMMMLSMQHDSGSFNYDASSSDSRGHLGKRKKRTTSFGSLGNHPKSRGYHGLNPETSADVVIFNPFGMQTRNTANTAIGSRVATSELSLDEQYDEFKRSEHPPKRRRVDLPQVPLFDSRDQSYCLSSNPGQFDVGSLAKNRRTTRTKFLSKQTYSRSMYAHRSENLKRKRSAQVRQQQIARRRRITVYRSYREGELPDVQITLKDIIKPLRALCDSDNSIAKSWILALFAELTEHISKDNKYREQSGLTNTEIVLLLEGTLNCKQSAQEVSNIPSGTYNRRSTATISCLLQSYMNITRSRYVSPVHSLKATSKESLMKNLVSLVQNLTQAAVQSSNFHLGALVLEEIIMNFPDHHEDRLQSISKASRSISDGTRAAINSRHLGFIKRYLSHLYSLMEETSISSSLLTVPLEESDGETSIALRLNHMRAQLDVATSTELSGNRRVAFNKYLSLLHSIESQSNNEMFERDARVNEEIKLLHQVSNQIEAGYLRCAAALQEWNLLHDSLSKRASGFEGNNFAALWSLELKPGGDLMADQAKFQLIDDFVTSCLQLNSLQRLQLFFESALQEKQKLTREKSPKNAQHLSLEGNLRNFIMDHFAPEAALCFIKNGYFDKAVPLLEYAVNRIAHKWANLHPLAFAARHSLIAKIPLIETLQQTLETRHAMMRVKNKKYSVLKGELTKSKVKSGLKFHLSALTDTWACSQLSIEHDTPKMWEAIRYARTGMLRILYDTVDQELRGVGAQKPSRTLQQHIVRCRQQLLLDTASGMRFSGALDVSSVYLRKLLKRHENNQLALPILSVQQELFESNFEMAIRKKHLHEGGAEMLMQLINDINKQISDLMDRHHEKNQIDILPLKFLRARAYSFLALNDNSESGRVEQKALDSFDSAVKSALTSSGMENNLAGKNNGSEILLYSIFCSQLLDSKENLSHDDEKMLVMKSIIMGLRALRLSASAVYASSLQDNCKISASAFLPRLLTLLRRYRGNQDIIEAFEEEISSIQPWQILHTNTQLLSMIGTGTYTQVSRLVLKMLNSLCEMYPDAVYFNLHITSSNLDKSSKQLLAPLESRIKSSPKGLVLRTFSAAVLQTVLPHHRYLDEISYVVNKMFGDIDKGNANVMDIQDIHKQRLRKLKELRDTFLMKEHPLLGSKIGTMLTHFQKKYESTIKSQIEIATHKRDPENLRSFLRKHHKSMKKLFDGEIRTDKVFRANSVSINRCSEWFSEYSDFGHGNMRSENKDNIDWQDSTTALKCSSIEIPGIYQSMNGTGGQIWSELHPRIASFGNQMLQLSSMRKPRRLKVIGSDYQTRYYLAKGGEDLRNDQRIQAMLMTMNAIFKRDTKCRRKRLMISTFAVVPMSGTHGIVQWLNNTEPLKAVFIAENREAYQSQSASTSRKRSRSEASIQQVEQLNGGMLCDFFQKHVGNKRLDKLSNYYKLARKHEKLGKSFHNLVENHRALNSHCLLRNRLLRMAQSPESFHHLRTQFCKAVATNSMCGYLLGIGDRHLENFLFSNEDGNLAQIDFGHTFGQATFLLPVPELLPFRLTNQLTSIMAPLPDNDLLRKHCVDVMKAMRSSKSELEAMTEAIVNDPLVEWTKGVSSRKGFDSDDDTEDSKTTYSFSADTIESLKFNPKARIKLFRDKLKGRHPSHIMRDEIQATEQDMVKKEMQPFLRLIEGPGSLRSHILENTIDAEQQVDCLIDLATDREILSRSWVGLTTWL